MIELLRRRLIGGKGSAVARLEQVCIAFQPDESAVALKVFDIQGVFDDAAACGNDEVIPGRNLMDDLCFDFAEGGLSFLCEEFGNGHFDALNDQLIGINKAFA